MAAVADAAPGLVVTVKEAKRNEGQSERFHAMRDDIAEQATFMGKKRSKAQWKVLLISAHSTATEEGGEIVPGLEGELVNIRESSAEMGGKRMSSLIDYTRAWGDMNGVRWREWVTA